MLVFAPDLLIFGYCQSERHSVLSGRERIAQEQKAKLWELRAALSLARLRRAQGRTAEARGLLAPVYGWFTEGFYTLDLKNAKALLDEFDGL
jgi:predicted ATPase